MDTKADIVIIGAGIVGTSAAWELAQAGVTNVVVVDQGPLAHTGGSTYHAPGLCFQTNTSRLMCTLAQWSAQAYDACNADGRETWAAVGGLEVATTPGRVAELHRRQNAATAYGLETRMVTPKEAVELCPLIEESAILAALHIPTDGLCRAVTYCHALQGRCMERGIRFMESTRVTDVRIDGSRVRAVETTAGTISCGQVLVAGGLWGPELQHMIGRPIPLLPLQHVFAWGAPIEGVERGPVESYLPMVRHQDQDVYYRQRWQGMGIGSYNHPPLPISPAELEREADGHQTAQGPFAEEHFTAAWDATRVLMPRVHAAGLEETFNGHFSFTIDGMPLLGESSHTKGLFLAEAIWITHAAGSARCIVRQMLGQPTGVDLGPAHPDRFQPHHSAPMYVAARGATQYAEVYDILHPLQPMANPRGLRRLPAHEWIAERGGVMLESAGWERPQWLEANASLPAPEHTQRRDAWSSMFWSPVIGKEHARTRTSAGLFDLTPFTKVEVEGPGATDWLNRMCTSELDVEVGRIVYTACLNETGGILFDITVTRLDRDRYLVVTGGASGPRDVAWLRSHLPAGDGVRMRDVTSAWAVFGLWGPKARAILQPLVPEDLSNEAFPYMRAQRIWVEHVPVLALRISYAGELGWELYAPTEYGAHLWERLMEAGADHGLAACGGGAFESLRVEKGYRFAGVDMHTDYTPDEAGLGFAVNLRKADFIGKRAVIAERARGSRKRLVPIVLDDPDAAPLGGEPILLDGNPVGYVTSANFGYSVGTSIAYGYLPADAAVPGTRAAIRIFDREVGGSVTSEPIFDPTGERLRA
ncbi:MAG: FAD-dependent oxidoreductase [Actinobacteria bacterium]|nr:FAD-dependent oxidoreductase [Actinomycetota bacterium]